MRVWLCEKPQQARYIARALGGSANGKAGSGRIETPAGVVTWALGHLLEQAPPESYDPQYERWDLAHLPIVPARWKLLVARERAAQAKVVKSALAEATEVVIATDADREGETIARELIEAAGFRGPIQRLWLSALDDKSIRQALGRLRPGRETEPLHWAAQGRARADWLVGMNLTRCATLLGRTLGSRDKRTVGRVQTPTLAMVVRRDREIEAFVARGFFELSATVATSQGVVVLRHAPPAHPEDRRIYERDQADALAARAEGATGPLRVTTRRGREAPPALFSLSGLQQAANRVWGLGADETLKIAQSLYETHQLTTYPRTDCTALPQEQADDIPAIVRNCAALPELSGAVRALPASPGPRPGVWDNSKITAHHAIVPTVERADLSRLSERERDVYLLIARHYLAALCPDAEFDETAMAMDANGVALSVTGRVQRVAGWRAVFAQGFHGDEESDGNEGGLLPAIDDGAAARVDTVTVDGKQTKPPPRYTEGKLIADMKGVARFASDPAIRARLRETSGIGTEATRGGIIAKLLSAGYIERRGKSRSIQSTPAGRALIDALPPVLCDAAVTALWEDQLEQIASGQLDQSARDTFVGNVAQQVQRLIAGMVAQVREMPPAEPRSAPPTKKMIELARAFADKLGHARLPPEVETSFEACSAYLDANRGEMDQRRAGTAPSPRQVAWAQELAAKKGLVLSGELLNDRTALSRFIESHRS